jgi:hypothetical protein
MTNILRSETPMSSLLDTVEPVAWRADDGFGDYFLSTDSGPPPDWEQLYSRETVERLLAEHRKQVLLEAAEEFGKRWTQAGMVQKELRRMAEGEK